MTKEPAQSYNPKILSRKKITVFACLSLAGLAFLLFDPALWAAPDKLVIEEIKPPPSESQDDIRILFAGDTHFSWGVRELQKKSGQLAPIQRMAPIFHQAHYRILNLETPLSATGQPLKNKSHIFNAAASNLSLLQHLRLNLAILANNHSMDRGAVGLSETRQRLQEKNIVAVGAGANETEALEPYTFSIKQNKFTIFAFNEIEERGTSATEKLPGAVSLTSEREQWLRKKIKEIREDTDLIFVSLHWGVEYFTKPTLSQIRQAHRLIDAGVDVIVGHHPHVPQAIEIYKQGVIIYSLGNFLFGSVNRYQTHNILAEVLFDPGQKQVRGVRIHPVWGVYNAGGPKIRPLTTDEAAEFWGEFRLQNERFLDDETEALRVGGDGVGELMILRP